MLLGFKHASFWSNMKSFERLIVLAPRDGNVGTVSKLSLKTVTDADRVRNKVKDLLLRLYFNYFLFNIKKCASNV